MAKNYLITGIGGQGVVTLGKLIAESAKKYEKNVSLYPIKGMAQRGGVITAFLRVGEYISPIIPEREADVIVALEISESLRYISLMKEGGILICNKRIFVPQSLKLKDYPTVDEVIKHFEALESTIVLFNPDTAIKNNSSGVLYENIALLGVMSALIPDEKYLNYEELKDLIKSYFRSHVNENLNSFEIGYNFGKKFLDSK